MHLPACPTNWEYTNHPDADGLLVSRSISTLSIVRRANLAIKDALSKDTRLIHEPLFRGLSPEHFPYFAGNYRGYAMRCLSDYEVGISTDKRVGHPAATVHLEMLEMSESIGRAQRELDLIWQASTKILPRELKLLRTIELAAAIFVYWLEIHPFANGNGHMARFVMVCLFGRHNIYFKSNMAIHPRPAEPQYSNAIAAYRNGHPQDLHLLLLGCF